MITRFFIIVGFCLAIAAALGSFFIFKSYQSERVQRLDQEQKMIQAQDSASSARAELDQQKAHVSDLEKQITDLKKASEDAAAQLSAKDSEIQNLKNDIHTKEQQLILLQNQIEVFRQKERMPAPVALGSTSTNAVGASTPATGANQTVIPIAPTGAAQVIPAEAPPSDDSRVLTVNRKFNFVVVNLGLRDGLRMGDKIDILQGGAPKAAAQIEKIYDKFSAATLLSENKDNPVHEGDAIRKAA